MVSNCIPCGALGFHRDIWLVLQNFDLNAIGAEADQKQNQKKKKKNTKNNYDLQPLTF